MNVENTARWMGAYSGRRLVQTQIAIHRGTGQIQILSNPLNRVSVGSALLDLQMKLLASFLTLLTLGFLRWGAFFGKPRSYRGHFYLARSRRGWQRKATQGTALSLHHVLEGIAQVGDEMKAVGNLNCLRGSLGHGASELCRAVPRDYLDLRLLLEPGDEKF